MLLNSFIYFIGGIGLFLYGMKLMSDGLELSTGSKLKKILNLLTTNKILGVVVGCIITAIIQSSTATTVMVVGFVNAGLMTLAQAVGVIIGANIGTTTTGLIIALNIHTIAPICIFIGAMLLLFTKKKKQKHIGMIIAGFGILFLGMEVMKDAMEPLSDLPWMIEFFKYTKNPLIGIIVGFTITALVQSSTASIGILLAVMSAGIITDLNQAIFILYGQNVGTCLTTVLSSFGSSKIAKKASMIHLVYNVIGVSIFVIVTLLPFGFVDFVKGLSSDVSQQFVYSHIILNILMAMILLPFSKYIIKITELIIRGKDEKKSDIDFEFIDEKSINMPSFALVQAYKEIERLAYLVLKNYGLSKKIALNKSENMKKDAQKVYKNEHIINLLGGRINKFLTKLNASELEYIDAKAISSLSRVIIEYSRVGDLSVNISKSFEKLFDENQEISKDAINDLANMMKTVEGALEFATEIFKAGEYDIDKISVVKQLENDTDIQNEEYKQNHIKRLDEEKHSFASGVILVKTLADLERMADHACNIAYSVKYKRNK